MVDEMGCKIPPDSAGMGVDAGLEEANREFILVGAMGLLAGGGGLKVVGGLREEGLRGEPIGLAPNARTDGRALVEEGAGLAPSDGLGEGGSD